MSSCVKKAGPCWTLNSIHTIPSHAVPYHYVELYHINFDKEMGSCELKNGSKLGCSLARCHHPRAENPAAIPLHLPEDKTIAARVNKTKTQEESLAHLKVQYLKLFSTMYTILLGVPWAKQGISACGRCENNLNVVPKGLLDLLLRIPRVGIIVGHKSDEAQLATTLWMASCRSHTIPEHSKSTPCRALQDPTEPYGDLYAL